VSASFDQKKDYLTVSIELTADSTEAIRPNWNLVRLTHNKTALAPFKLWAERKEVQKDSLVRSRFVFAKPNIPRNLAGTAIVLPLDGKSSALTLGLAGGGK
jgi:hypothetical protein